MIACSYRFLSNLHQCAKDTSRLRAPMYLVHSLKLYAFFDRRFLTICILFLAATCFAIAASIDSYLWLWFRKLPLSPTYFYWELVSSYLWVFLVPLIFYLTRRYPIKKGSLVSNGIIHLSAGILLSAIHLQITYVIGGAIVDRLGYPVTPLALEELANIIFRISWRLLIYLVIATVCHSFAIYQRLRVEELKTARLEAELTQTRLKALKVRLNPELIFRSFAGIASAMEKDLNQATRMIVSLGDELRSRLKQKDVIKREKSKSQQVELNSQSTETLISTGAEPETLRHDEPTPGLHWKWLAVAWILTGMFFTARMAMFRISQGNSLTVLNVILMNAPWFLWAFATPTLLRFYARFPLESKHFLRNFGIHLLVGASFWIVTFMLGFFSQIAMNRFAGKQSSDLLIEMINMGFAKHLLAYWSFLFFVRANRYYNRYVQRKLTISELEFQLTSAQLQALKMQLHPHFLFNSLHSLMGLIQEDLEAARRMLFRLQHFFELTLQDMTEQKVPLKKELEFLNCYLDIEKVRFPDRLNVTLDVEPDAMKVEVPNLILQPLVENAVKHGISHRSDCGEIHIQAGSIKDTLQLIVSDNGTGIAEERQHVFIKEGIGLSNTRERLQRIYGASHRLLVDPISGGGFRVLIEIPI